MDPNSSAKYSKGYVINSESKVCHQQDTIQLSMALQKPSIRLLESCSRNLSQKVNVIGIQIRRMLVGFSHDGENSDKSHAIFLGAQMWSCTPTGDLNPIFMSRFDNQDGRRGKASIARPEVGSFRRQTATSPATNRALSSSDFQSFNKKVREQIFKKGDIVLAVRRL